MLTAARIKQIRSLREKKFRDETGLFVVEGEKMVREALESGFDVVEIYREEEVGEAAMARLSLLSSPPPVLAVVRKPRYSAADAPMTGLSLALDSVRDPGNMGTIIRTADWFGVTTVFASFDSVDIYNPKVIQATMGGIFRCRLIYADIPEVCRSYRSAGLPVWGTFLDGKNIYGCDLGRNGLIVMGNESRGISPEVEAEVDSRILIPRAPGSRAESLNVAVATAVTLSVFSAR